MKRRRTVLTPDARRQQLLVAATRVFAERGYRSANITAIVETAGVARGTFYLYFESKAQVFLAIADDFYDRLELAIAALPIESGQAGAAQDGRAVLRAGFRGWLEFFHQHRLAATVMLKEAAAIDARFERSVTELRRAAYAHLTERCRRFQQRGLMRPSLPPELVAHLQVGMFEELVRTFVLGTEQPPLDLLADQMADFEWNGVRPAPR
jgi:AcrR family transcriptional regulator